MRRLLERVVRAGLRSRRALAGLNRGSVWMVRWRLVGGPGDSAQADLKARAKGEARG